MTVSDSMPVRWILASHLQHGSWRLEALEHEPCPLHEAREAKLIAIGTLHTDSNSLMLTEAIKFALRKGWSLDSTGLRVCVFGEEFNSPLLQGRFSVIRREVNGDVRWEVSYIGYDKPIRIGVSPERPQAIRLVHQFAVRNLLRSFELHAWGTDRPEDDVLEEFPYRVAESEQIDNPGKIPNDSLATFRIVLRR